MADYLIQDPKRINQFREHIDVKGTVSIISDRLPRSFFTVICRLWSN